MILYQVIMILISHVYVQCTFGSVIRATPPCRRMSAGTLSNAITAHAYRKGDSKRVKFLRDKIIVLSFLLKNTHYR